jgi:hypothetical protein
MRLLLILLPLAVLLAGCGDDEPLAMTATPQLSATRAPTEAVGPEATAVAQPTQALRQVTGLFLEPRPSEPDRFVSVPPRPPSPFAPWDRESVVVYDVLAQTEVNFGPGLIPSISPNGTKLAINVVKQGAPLGVRIVEISTKATVVEFEYTGGLASFIDDNYLYLPGGPGQPEAHDLSTGERTPLDEIIDPILKARLAARASGSGGTLVDDGKYRLVREAWDEKQDLCRSDPDPDVPYELCQAGAFEQWRLEDVSTGAAALAFRAYDAIPAGKREIVIATSPQCQAADGSLIWCAEMHRELRDMRPERRPYPEVNGTANIFIVDIESGKAEFVATASFSATTAYSWPQNWPLIANETHIVWTGSYCSQENPANTQIYDRATGQVTELDASLWVGFTATGDLGVDPFGPRAILDIETLQWNIVLPESVTDVGESPDGRYLIVGGVLGHGGLC